MTNLISAAAFLAMFDEDVRPAILARAAWPGITHLVMFECQLFDSSSFGNRTMLPIGPGRTFETLEAVQGKWLKDLPSQREYAVAHCPAGEFKLVPPVAPRETVVNVTTAKTARPTDFSVGQRIRMSASTDLWMRGATHGNVVGIGRLYVTVKLDKLQRPVKVQPNDLLAV